MKTFTDYVIQNHPDPDSIGDERTNWGEIGKLAQAYAYANAIEFAKFVLKQPLSIQIENSTITIQNESELLQKYREQNK